MAESRLAAAAAVVALSFAFACSESPTDATLDDLAPQFDHKGTPHGGSGGGKPGSGNDFPVTITLGTVGTGGISNDGIDGDGDGGFEYDDGVDGSLRIRGDGILLWNVDASRQFALAFGDPVASTGVCADDFSRPDCPSEPHFTRVGALRVLATEDNNDELPGQLLAMAEDGGTAFGMLRTRVESTDGVVYQLRYQFLDNDENNPANDDIATESDFLDIERNGNKWTITATANDRALMFSRSGRGKKAFFTDLGSFTMPFVMTVTCMEDCPVP